MSEQNKKTVETEGQETKPVAKARVGKKSETEGEKVGLVKKVKNWCKRHKEAIITGGVAFIGGAGTAIGGSYLYERHQQRKQERANRENVYVPAQQDYDSNSLDPNI